MNDAPTTELAKPVRKLTGVRVEIDAPSYAYGWSRDPERIAKSLEMWAKEFNDFLRDHRSQDALDISVIRDIEDVCSLCGHPWETVPPDDDCPHTSCAWCGEQVEEQSAPSPEEEA